MKIIMVTKTILLLFILSQIMNLMLMYSGQAYMLNIEVPWSNRGDFVVDTNDNIYIFTEYGVILKYNSFGNLVGTKKYDYQSNVAAATDVEGNLYVLSGEKVVKYDQHMTAVEEYKIPDTYLRKSYLVVLENGKMMSKDVGKEDEGVGCGIRKREPVNDGIIFKIDSGCRREERGIYDKYISNGHEYQYSSYHGNKIIKFTFNDIDKDQERIYKPSFLNEIYDLSTTGVIITFLAALIYVILETITRRRKPKDAHSMS